MKKKIAVILTCLMLAATVMLTGCAGAGYSKIKVANPQNTDYVVYSNGGNSVQYGNYIYFINGTAGYTDADNTGKTNEWNNVIKGALYRAQLKGDKVGREFVIKAEADGNEFEFTAGKDYDDKDIKIANVQLIAPKVIGTSGYNNGGIFIFDNYVYYATPNNEKDKTGTVQVSKTDFFRTRLDGGVTQKLYTTQADSATSPYAFYKMGDSVYLVCHVGSDVISVKVTGDKKPEKPVTIMQKATSVFLPYDSTYDSTNNPVTLGDFIYTVRAADETKDSIRVGSVIEAYSPDGQYGAKLLSTTNTGVTLESVRDNVVFYRAPNSTGNTAIFYSSFHDAMMSVDASGNAYCKPYKDYQDSLASKDDSTNKLIQISGSLLASETIANYKQTYCFRPGGNNSDLVYAFAVMANGAHLISNLTDTAKHVYNAAMTFSFIDGEYAYFTDSEAKTLFRTEWDKAITAKTAETMKIQVSHGDMTDNGLKADITAGYVVYMGGVDTWATGYANFKKINGIEGASEYFVGAKIEADLKPVEEEEEEEEEKGCGSFAAVGGVAGASLAVIALSGALALIAFKKKQKKA